MVELNSNDYNLVKIGKDSKLYNFQTPNHYRIYGLKRENNPLVYLETQYFDRANEIVKFFNTNKIQVEIREIEDTVTRIGLRKDLRKHVILSSSVIQTIIYALEGRLHLTRKFSIPGIPHFKA